MERKTKIMLVRLFIFLCIFAALFISYPWLKAFFYSWTSPSLFPAKEIIIRNMTKQAIRYEVRPIDSVNMSKRTHLKRNAIDEFAARKSFLLTYSRFGNEVTEYLIPGASYCFRYDENGLVHLYLGSHMRKDVEDLAPYVATPIEVAGRMLEMGKVRSTDVLYDLGCGDGRIVNLAAKEYGARGVGVDIDPHMIRRAEVAAKKAGVNKLAKFKVEDIMKTDFSEATVIVLYLLPESNALLKPLFERQLRHGVRIVTHNYIVPGWENKQIDSASIKDQAGERHTIFLYLF